MQAVRVPEEQMRPKNGRQGLICPERFKELLNFPTDLTQRQEENTNILKHCLGMTIYTGVFVDV